MGIIIVLLPLSILLAVGALIGYLWAVKSGQFDDLDTPQHRILFEQDSSSDNKQ